MFRSFEHLQVRIHNTEIIDFHIVYSHLKMVEWPKHVADREINEPFENCCKDGIPAPLVYTQQDTEP
jgi:hypothetical protein